MAHRSPVKRARSPSKKVIESEFSNAPYYTRVAREHPVLTCEQEQNLFRQFAETVDMTLKIGLQQKLVLHNLGLCFSISERFMWRGLSPDDLVQEGIFGLWRAIDGFEYHRGLKFSTYAAWWVYQAMSRAVQRQRSIIYIPREAYQQLKSEGEDSVRLPQTVSLSETIRGKQNDGSTREAFIPAHILSPLSKLEAAEEVMLSRRQVSKMLGYIEILPISDRDKRIFKAYVCPDPTVPPRTLKSVGEEFGVNKERTRQINDYVWRILGTMVGGFDATTFQEELNYIEDLRGLLDDDSTPTPIEPVSFSLEERTRLLAKVDPRLLKMYAPECLPVPEPL